MKVSSGTTAFANCGGIRAEFTRIFCMTYICKHVFQRMDLHIYACVCVCKRIVWAVNALAITYALAIV